MKSSVLTAVLTILIGIGVYVAADDPVEYRELPDRIEDLEIPVLPFERNVAFASWILELNEDRVRNWLRQSTQDSWNVKPKTRKELQSFLLSRLVALNPAQALEFAMQRLEPNRSTMMTMVFQEWAQGDLRGAIQHVKNLPSNDRRLIKNSIFISSEEYSPDEIRIIERELAIDLNPPSLGFHGTVISPDHGIHPVSTQVDPLVGDSIGNPSRLWYDIVEKARPNSIHFQDLAEVATAWVNESGIGALEVIRTSLTDYNMRKNVLRQTLVRLMPTLPTQAFDFALKTQFPGRNKTIGSMVSEWARTDPIAAINRVHSMSSSEFRRHLERRVFSNWLSDNSLTIDFDGDPSLILDSLHLIPEGLQGKASAVATQRMVWSASPIEAAETVLRLDEHSQLEATRTLVKEWYRKDRESALEWIKTKPEIESVRTEALNTLVWSIAPGEPKVAFEIARELPTPDHGFGLEGEVIATLAQFRPDTAKELLPQVREGKTKLRAYLSVANVMLRSGRTKESLELGAQLPDEGGYAYGYYLRLGAAWARFDPQGLVDSLQQFPTAGVRSVVAVQQILWNDSTKLFSEQQVQQLHSHLTDEQRELLERRGLVDESDD